MESSYAYTFLLGLYMGGYTNFFSNLIITGVILRVTNPELFTANKLIYVKQKLLKSLNLEEFVNSDKIQLIYKKVIK